MTDTPLTPPGEGPQGQNPSQPIPPGPLSPQGYATPQGGYQQAPGFQQGVPGFPQGAPGYSQAYPAHQQAPLPAGLKYNAAGKVARPVPWLIALIVLLVSLALVLIALPQYMRLIGSIPSSIPQYGQLMTIVWIALISLAVNIAATIAMWMGYGWGRIAYAAMAVIGLVVAIATSSLSWQTFIPFIVVALLFAPQSTAYLKEVAKQRGA